MKSTVGAIAADTCRPTACERWTFAHRMGAAALIAVLLFAPGCRQSSPAANGQRFAAALADYMRDLRSRGEGIPAAVALDTLVRLGYLTRDDARAFEGAKVVFHSGADETRPESMLIEAILPDGSMLAVMGDGSVQQFSRDRWEQYQKSSGQPGGAANRSQSSGLDTNRTLVGVSSDEKALLKRFLAYRDLERVTEAQIDVAASVATFCRDPKDLHGPHIRPGIHLFVSREMIQAKAKRGFSRYPVGSLVVKEKFDRKGDSKPSLITVMEKIADAGRVEDWRFFMVRLSDRSFVRDKASASCVDCHSRYAKTDFISSVTDDLVMAFARRPKKASEPTPASVERFPGRSGSGD